MYETPKEWDNILYIAIVDVLKMGIQFLTHPRISYQHYALNVTFIF